MQEQEKEKGAISSAEELQALEQTLEMNCVNQEVDAENEKQKQEEKPKLPSELEVLSEVERMLAWNAFEYKKTFSSLDVHLYNMAGIAVHAIKERLLKGRKEDDIWRKEEEVDE